MASAWWAWVSRWRPTPFCRQRQNREGEAGRPNPSVVRCPIREECLRHPTLASALGWSSREGSDQFVAFPAAMPARRSVHHVVHLPHRRVGRRPHRPWLARSTPMTGGLRPIGQPRMAIWSWLGPLCLAAASRPITNETCSHSRAAGLVPGLVAKALVRLPSAPGSVRIRRCSPKICSTTADLGRTAVPRDREQRGCRPVQT
jgi:hypothetical protein